ncbi:MAG: tetratricopeptide repeat protein [Bryobacteraceae bacterium]
MARSRVLIVAVLASLTGVVAQAQTQKQFKDRTEYDLYEAIRTGTDPVKRLADLNQWKAKYPQTDYGTERLQAYLTTYQQLARAEEMWNTGKELLATDSKNLTALYWMTLLVKSMGKTDPDRLDTGEKAARGFLGVIETPPAGVSADDWKKQKDNFTVIAHTTLGWIAMSRKNDAEAEKELIKVLQMSPGAVEANVMLGTIIRNSKKLDRYPEVLFHFARAGFYDGSGSLDPKARQTYQVYFEKAYAQFHGDKSEIDEVIKVAKAVPLPPEGFKIKDFVTIAKENEEKFERENPMLALWMSIKRGLSEENGPAFWEALKGTAFPAGNKGVQKIKGRVISIKPATRPKEIVLGITSADTAEVTLRLEQPLTTKADPGTEIEFEGVAAEFTKDPFMLTFDVEKEQIVGWPAPAKPTPPARRPAGKKKR